MDTRVTTKERLVQQTSAIDTLLSIIEDKLPKEALDIHTSRIQKDVTIADLLSKARMMLRQMTDDSNDLYWDTIDYPGGTAAFPHR